MLLALPFTIIGGADSLLLQIVKNLIQNDYQVSLVTTIDLGTAQMLTFGDNGPRYEELTSDVFQLPRFLPNESSWKEFIFYLIESRQINLLYIVGSAYMYKLLPALKRRFPQLKVVDQLFNEGVHMASNREYTQYIDLNITDNNQVENAWLTRYKEKKARVKFIPTGVDIDYFSPQHSFQSGDFYYKYPFLKGKFVVSFFGRLSEEKWPELFVEIAARFKQDDRVHFVLCGNGPLYPKIQEQIAQLELNNKIYLPGFVEQNQLMELMSASNLVTLTSKVEGRPFIVLESLAMGIPVLVPAVGGLGWIVQSGYNGFLVRGGEVDDFEAAIQQCLDDPALCQQMRRNARQYALEQLDVTLMQRQYLAAFGELLGNEALDQ